MEIKGKNIMITGASRGIGLAFAKSVAQDKTHLHLVVRNEDKNLKEELLAAGAASVTFWTLDLANKSQVNKFIEDSANLKIDILFNNAGQFIGGFLETQKTEEIEKMLEVNVHSLIHLTKAFLPRMLKRKKGKIINHASVAALMHFPGNSTYAATKAAVWAFTNCLRMELRETGVSTLNLITPGVKTSLYETIEDKVSKFFEIPKTQLAPAKYADMIREAVLLDLETLEPKGWTGIALRLSKYVPKAYDFGVRSRFHR